MSRIPFLMCLGLIAAASFADDAPVRVPLWEAGAPQAQGKEEADQPFMEIHKPRRGGSGVGLVVYPGGGYKNLALDHEGKQVADWANANGMYAFVVHYRLLPKYPMPVPFIDGTRAIRRVRANAAKYKLDPARIGVMGFSAGGHLSSMVAVHNDAGKKDDADPVERVSSRPDFTIIVYPGINFQDVEKPAMLGEKFTPEMKQWINTDHFVTKNTPPAFLFHTDEDKADSSCKYYLALRKAGVPGEMHIYQQGRHGMGLAIGHPILGNWPSFALRWLNGLGFMDKPAK